VYGNADLDDKPVAGDNAAVIGKSGERCGQRNAFLTSVGKNSDHASIDADHEATTTVNGGAGERRFK
jgi:hypothetical protein